MAAYTHDTSRELDPQLHTHAVAANLTYDGTEFQWKALQASGLYERRSYLTKVYRNALAREVCALGYEIENRGDVAGKDKGFEIAGVSRRSSTITVGEVHSEMPRLRNSLTSVDAPQTDNEVAVLIRETRADKLQEISTEQLHCHQLERLTTRTSETCLATSVKRHLNKTRHFDLNIGLLRHRSPMLEEHVFERLSVAKEHEVLAEALRHGRGRVNLRLSRASFLENARVEI